MRTPGLSCGGAHAPFMLRAQVEMRWIAIPAIDDKQQPGHSTMPLISPISLPMPLSTLGVPVTSDALLGERSLEQCRYTFDSPYVDARCAPYLASRRRARAL